MAAAGLRTVCDFGFDGVEVGSVDELEPGDIILLRSDGHWMSRVISGLDGYWSHSAIYIGDSEIAHAYSAGIAKADLATTLAKYSASGAVRPGHTPEQRRVAADFARGIADQQTCEYDGFDLGLAYAMLRRVAARDRDALTSVADDGLESAVDLPECDFSSTCSGLVYRSYSEAGARLEIVPAPGLRLVDGWIELADEPDLLSSLLAEPEYAAADALDDGLEGLDTWRDWANRARILAGVAAGWLALDPEQDRVPIESGVTPSDLWCSPSAARRWFLGVESAERAKAAAADCPRATPATPSEFVTAMQAANESFDHAGAAEIVDELLDWLITTDDEFPDQDVKKLLSLLRRRRWFDQMERVANALIADAQDTPHVRRQLAQALIDQSSVPAAISVLDPLVADTAPDGSAPNPSEYAEAVGLQGRAFKQLYVDAGTHRARRRQGQLVKSLEAYLSIYDQDPSNLWHGINAVALLARAERDAVSLDGLGVADGGAAAMASRILATVEDWHGDGKAGVWDLATAAEACLALGDLDQAERWTQQYVNHPGGDAFEYESTRRQLVEVWGLQPHDGPGARLLPLLNSAVLASPGGVVDVDSNARAAGLEKVFGAAQFRSAEWVRRLGERLRSVVRVEGLTGTGFGTGFLVDGRDFAAALAGSLFILTNHHVLRRGSNSASPQRPARFNFEYAGVMGSPTEVVWQSPSHELDASLIAFDAELPQSVKPITDFAESAPEREPDAGPERAYVIGHPQGRPLSVSIHDNIVLDRNDRLIHYRSPTEEGSSGSPVFDEDLELTALHHRGMNNMARLHGASGTYPANEGILLGPIRYEASRDLDPTGQRIVLADHRAADADSAVVDLRVSYDDVLESFPDELQQALDGAEAARRSLSEEVAGLEFLVVDMSRWAPGETITVAFLDGDAELHSQIAEVVAEIEAVCNIHFDFGFDEATGTFRRWSETDTEHGADIRVSFDQPGFWSLVGTASIDESIGEPHHLSGGRAHQRSLNLGGFDTRLPPRWRATVLHEFLHALAFAHEHQNQRGPCQNEFRWHDDPGYVETQNGEGRFVADAQGRRPGIYTYLSGFPNFWDPEKVDRNLRASGAGDAAAGPFDEESIMLYRFDPLFYKSDPSPCAPAGDGLELSEGDKRGLVLLYPHGPGGAEAADTMATRAGEALAALDQAASLESAGLAGRADLCSSLAKVLRRQMQPALRN